ncbi:SRPBCC family protein [soil metagenome]
METNDRDLVLVRTVKASPAKVYEAYTTPELLKQWWAPKPFETPEVEIDARPGGRFMANMEGPDGTRYPNEGVFLEALPGERLVFTDAFTSGWVPNEAPFLTVVVTFEAVPEGTKITSLARHGYMEAKKKHEEMGFFDGWGAAQDQLAGLVEA